MDLALLRTFVTVHRAGSFTRAAALLGLSQPAVTGQIRTLERQLGRPLFLRQARGVTPTTIGRRTRPPGRPASGRPGGDHRGRSRRGVRAYGPCISPGPRSSPRCAPCPRSPR